MAERARFTIDGRPAEAEAGTSLLAALWNAGRRAVRTSVSGEARGPLCGMGTCFECRVTVDGEPHRRACLEAVREGMVVLSSRGTSVEPVPRDPPARPSADSLPRESSWVSRGSSPGQIGAPRNDKAEVVIVGAGPAGIAAAVHAAEAGSRTLLLDEQARPGGQVWRGEPPRAARGWLERLDTSGVMRLDRATVVDAPRPGELLVEREGRPLRVVYERLVLATGARELFLPFPGWTLPGVVGAGGAQALLKAGARFEGLRVVVTGSGPLLPAVATTLKRSGARLVGVVEQAPLPRLAAFAASLWREPGKLAEGLGYGATLAGVPYRTGAWVREAVGREAVETVLVTDGRREEAWACDALACGFGLVPSLELPHLLGCETTGDAVAVDASQRTSVDGVLAAGELVGVAGVDQALATGAIAGLAAAGRRAPDGLLRERERARAFGARLAAAFALRDELKALGRPETTLCRCEDVPLGRVAAAASAREAKLDSRAGMGPCQGRVCGSALAFLRGLPPDTVRPPLVPVPIAVLAAEDGGASAVSALSTPSS
jgi:NADPH-dependent 2,4-dienoyl-CoA reductase/sulfur reductase-like enzyme